MEQWYGFDLIEEWLCGREVKIVRPNIPSNGHWALKTEYFGAFPNVEIELLNRGYHIAHIKNITRWHVSEDTDARAALANHMHQQYGLSEKCAIVGMSCGGMQGIYFAAKYPEYVSCMYLDAPVVNLLSCPAGLGSAEQGLFEEFVNDTGMDKTSLLSYRNHPLDKIPALVKNNIPIILVCGDSDTVVPYEENGRLIDDAYRTNSCNITTIIKPGCNHHPHGLDDVSPIVDFIMDYDK